MVAHQSADQEFRADAVGPGQAEGVVNEECVADGFVNCTIQDVRQELSLYGG